MVLSRLVATAIVVAPLSMSLIGCGGSGNSTTPAPTSKPDGSTTTLPQVSTTPASTSKPDVSTTTLPQDSTTRASTSKPDVSTTTPSRNSTTPTTRPDDSTTTPPLLDQCAPVMRNVDCQGYDMQTVYGVSTTDECCARCTSTKHCGAYTHEAQSQRCFLKRWCDYLVASEGKHSSMPERLPETPPPGCVEPSLGIGFNCEGEGTEELAVVQGNSQHDCCDLCSKTDGCLVYSFSKSARTCSLKRNCPVKPRNADFITGWVVNPEQQRAARYQVGRGHYEIPGYKCGGGDPATVLFYPKGAGPFPVVVYGHGAWGYVDGSDDWLETVSSLGLIVIAPFQGKDPHPCKKAFADDLLNAIQGSKEGGAALHPALSTANWTKTGIFGHSKGAKYATLAASKGKESHGVSAVVCSSDAPSKHYHNTVPTMLTTGTLDKFNDADQILHYWEKSTAEPKVYVNLKDAYHMEVQEGMRLNLLTGQFLSCHVSGNPKDCDVIYGTGDDSICKVNAYADGSCCVQQGSERISNEFCTTTTTTSLPSGWTTTTSLPSGWTTTTSLPSCSNQWEQCGGRHWQGPTECCAGLVCQFQNDEYSQCASTTLEANHTVMV